MFKSVIFIAIIFPIVFGLIQGIWFRHNTVKYQLLYHICMLGIQVLLYGTYILYLYHYNVELYIIAQAALIIILYHYILYDKIIALAKGKPVLSYGCCTVWDKFWSGKYLYDMKDNIIKSIYLLILKLNLFMQIIALIFAILLTIKFLVL